MGLCVDRPGEQESKPRSRPGHRQKLRVHDKASQITRPEMGLLTQFNEARTTAKPSERHTRATHDKKVHRVRELNVQNEIR